MDKLPDMCTPVNSPKDAEKQSFYQRAGDDELLFPGQQPKAK